MHQQTATMDRQTSVEVRHEDLRSLETAIATASEIFQSHQLTFTKVPAGCSLLDCAVHTGW